MSTVENDYDFEEFRATAKRIDKGILNLEKKLSKVNNFGLLLAPEETKRIALNVLEEYECEIKAMRENCEHCAEEEKQILNEYVVNNQNITNYIEQLRNDLNKIEDLMKKDRKYQPYQDSIEEENETQHDVENEPDENFHENHENNVSQIDNRQMLLQESVIHGEECNEEPILKTVNGATQYDKSPDVSSFIGKKYHGDTFNLTNNSILATPVIISKHFNKHLEKGNDSLDVASISSLSLSARKNPNLSEDICKTPVDPGISLTSMKLLKRSNIKTKVYKTNLFGDHKAD